MNRKIVRSLLIVIVVLSLFKLLRHLDNPYTQQKKMFSQLNIENIICEKYLDYENHTYQILVFCNEQKIEWLLETSGFYNFVQEGDSIVKHNGRMEIRVLRETIDTTFIISVVEENPEIFDLW